MNQNRSSMTIRVLIVEDETGDAFLIKKTLKQAKDIYFDVAWTESLASTKQKLVDSDFDVILLDLSLPDSNGLQTLKAIQNTINSLIPIVILSGYNDMEFALTALELGAVDYVTKDIVKNSDSLVRVIRYALLRIELEKSTKLLEAANLDLSLLRTLNNAAIIAETALNGKITFVNKQFCRISGYNEHELIGTTHKMLQSGIHTKEFYLNLWATIKSGEIWSGEICNCQKTGDYYWMQTIIFPIFYKNNGMETHYKYAMVGLDITEKKKRELEMQKRAALYEAAIETTDGFCRITSEGDFLDVSDGYCLLSGHSREDLLRMNILKLSDNFALSCQQFDHIIQDAGKTFEIEQRRKDGSIWLAEITASHSTLNDGTWFVFLHDITERIELQKRDKIHREQIIQMQKIDSIGRLAAGIGHDFNNMLTGILGYTELNKIISEDISDDKLKNELIHNLHQVEIASYRAVELIAKMMNYCRQNTESKENELLKNESTSKVIREVIDMVQAGLTNKFKIELALNDAIDISISAIDLHQIMTNLLVNARDAMKINGGVIKVKLEKVKMQTQRCTACLMAAEGDFIELSVSDSGSGIDSKIIAKIFDAFFTTKKEGEGTGLGLSTVSGMIHHAHGHILVESELEIGTTFRLLFPVEK